ncbi:MAG TPA: hypothetical protein VKD90_09315 [Gemmataceae bacterium]|nr:hypothetical protein [Gemmataceae bacterium]
MIRSVLTVATCLFAAAVAAADTKYSVKVEDKEPPKDLGDAVRAVLDAKAMTVADDKGKVICTVWAAKSLETKATADQAKAGLKYTQLEETALVGAVQFPEGFRDYRKSNIKPGVYTLRLGIQPEDGDHQGTAPYNEFCLLIPAADDKKPDVIDAETLHQQSNKSTTRKHPGVMLLFPNKEPKEAPAVETKPKEHWVLSYRVPATAGAEKAFLGFSLVVVGVTMAE